ncbi:MAG: aspartate-semialdehyde dehydrogenase, partial [Mariprofundaceae bacterium]|nr:aspartate-semialdehyde dehydrogenase [Mariprofundaceae bacterium]
MSDYLTQKDAYNIAVVGATGAVGQTMLEILAERNFPIADLVLLASSRSAGSSVEFKGKQYIVQDLEQYDPAGLDIALFSAGGGTSLKHAPRFAEVGCYVVDNSS